jgi:hypothetical protein
MRKCIWIGGLLGALALSPAGTTDVQAQSSDIVPVPLVQFQDGDTAEIRSVLAAKEGWWSSFRIAFGDDDFEPSPWTPDDELLPLRLRMKGQFFGRELNVRSALSSVLAEHPSDSSRGLGRFLCNEVSMELGLSFCGGLPAKFTLARLTCSQSSMELSGHWYSIRRGPLAMDCLPAPKRGRCTASTARVRSRKLPMSRKTSRPSISCR